MTQALKVEQNISLEQASTDAAFLEDKLSGLSTQELLHKVLLEVYPGRIGIVSSFGAEAAVLLDLIARVDPATPVLFLDTGKHFPETLAYRDLLVDRLRLRDVRVLTPKDLHLQQEDPSGTLWESDPDKCCDIRKVRPLDLALEGFDAWITGRKRFHGGTRKQLPVFESDEGRVKINPLADWTAEQIEDYYLNFALPRHPLFDQGYLSIGCATCTAKPVEGADVRSGRWMGNGKTECGIHKAKWAVYS
ncbi:phosphoadenylyl-sulfate reductase [Aestuariispira ectoiniformans]|uniref:phosphoadenylyl-sulfate reductase n=1 Tax=Aestuariispira ectoiniformans TaxID=2775080 RepID=UPI00223BF357|nr:phosphoadenylyl-sulfate reductase [Aestuariispira ectoiniformans]